MATHEDFDDILNWLKHIVNETDVFEKIAFNQNYRIVRVPIN